MKKYSLIKPFLFAFLFVFSCDEEKLEVVNPNALSEGTFFQSEGDMEVAVNGIYAALQANQLYNREYFFLHDLLSDDNVGNPQLEPHRREILEHNLSSDNVLIVSVYNGLYRIIQRANTVLAKMDELPEGLDTFTTEERNRLSGEAHFLRAWAYFELVSLWGPVPKITEPITEVTEEGEPRASEEEIFTLIFEDLDLAEEWLPLKSNYAAADLGRATKGAAQALAGKVHMWRANYSAAIQEFEKVIQSGQYSLDVPYIDNFTEENENNAESIFEVQLAPNGTGNAWSGDGSGNAEVTFRGQEYTPQAGWNNVDPNPELVASYEEGDIRYQESFYFDGELYNNGADTMEISRPGWQKYSNAYQQPTEDQFSGINFRVIRYADVLLMMAEAQNEVNGPAAALPYINMVRDRAGLEDLELSDIAGQEELFDIIVHERKVELAGEQIRNRDIRRWRRQGKLDSDPISYFRPHHDLLPIPESELQNNPALTLADQNPGY